MQKKKIAAALLGSVMVLSSVTVSAAWKSAGYDTTDLNDIKKVYNEVIGGKYTSKTKSEALEAKDIVWIAEGYELDYPHAGYDRLYLEGNAQKITRYNNLFPQWETRYADYFWEIYNNPTTGGHRIYQRQQTKIPDLGWRWDFGSNEAIDKTLFVPTNRNAAVTTTYKVYGVGPYNLQGYIMTDAEKDMYRRFGVADALNAFPIEEGTSKEIKSGTFFHSDNLSKVDENGQYVWSDVEIADYVGSVMSKYLTGPSLRGDDPTKDVAAEYLRHGDAWQWNDDSLIYGGGKVDWTGVMYESREPYRMYQYMIINGIIFDGHNDLPRIYRYTGGKASPKVEWKYAYPVNDAGHSIPDMILKETGDVDVIHQMSQDVHKHSIIEFKYLDGKLARDDAGNPVWRYSGEFENCYVTTTDTEILVWVTGVDTPVQVIERTNHNLGNYAGYMGSANFVAN